MRRYDSDAAAVAAAALEEKSHEVRLFLHNAEVPKPWLLGGPKDAVFHAAEAAAALTAAASSSSAASASSAGGDGGGGGAPAFELGEEAPPASLLLVFSSVPSAQDTFKLMPADDETTRLVHRTKAFVPLVRKYAAALAAAALPTPGAAAGAGELPPAPSADAVDDACRALFAAVALQIRGKFDLDPNTNWVSRVFLPCTRLILAPMPCSGSFSRSALPTIVCALLT